MKVYWSDREGKPAPVGAVFSWRPFDAASLTPPTDKGYLPSREKWIEVVEKALALIQRKELDKVVLARLCTLELKNTPDPFAIAAALQKKAQGAFVFCLPLGNETFLGATPERLFARRGRTILSEAVAGTRRRGKTLEEDQQLQRELLASAKDLREFTPVQAHLQNALSPLCVAPPTFSPVTVHQTQNVQHLYSQCTATLKDGVTDEEILAHLHPTPALCGTPKQKAFSLIRELEPFERGLYGGVIGWTTPDASEWVVAIRSCLLRGKTATLFSGTGIVEGSDPEEEWEELNQKLKLYDGILAH